MDKCVQWADMKLVYAEIMKNIHLFFSFVKRFSKKRGAFRFFCVILPNKQFNMSDKRNLNRIKVMLAEKKETSKWLIEQVGKNSTTVSRCCSNSIQGMYYQNISSLYVDNTIN